MVAISVEFARNHRFYEKTIRLSFAEIARRPYKDGATVNEALDVGWRKE